MPRVHRHVFKRLKEAMRVGTLGEGEKVGREEVSLSRARQEIKGSTGGPKEIYEPSKIITTVHVSGFFSRNVVLSFHQILKGAHDPKD